MTKTLATLVKVNQHAVDEQRRVVFELEALQNRMIEGLAHLKAERAAEKLVAETDEQAGELWPAYVVGSMKREREFEKQITALEKQIATARDELRRRFADLKKYEIAKDHADTKEAQEAARDERLEMDEIAGQRDARKGRPGDK